MAHFDINRCFNSPYNWLFSPVTPVSSTNKTVHRDIIEILLKVALNTITLTLIQYCALLGLCQFWVVYIYIYHIFCCNMFVFACPIAKSQCWLFAGQCPQISVFAPEFNFRYLRSCLKVQGKMMHANMYKIVFQSNQHISTYCNKV